MKKILRKRNKLVQMSIILQDDENEEREFVCLNYDVKYLDEILN